MHQEIQEVHLHAIGKLRKALLQPMFGSCRYRTARAVLENKLRPLLRSSYDDIKIKNGAKVFPSHKLPVISNFLGTTTLLAMLHGRTRTDGSGKDRQGKQDKNVFFHVVGFRICMKIDICTVFGKMLGQLPMR